MGVLIGFIIIKRVKKSKLRAHCKLVAARGIFASTTMPSFSPTTSRCTSLTLTLGNRHHGRAPARAVEDGRVHLGQPPV
jgi:hypothetical protein